jgi:hypothetical protein
MSPALTEAQQTAMREARAAKGPVMHTVRCATDGFIRLRLTRKLAMAVFCTECLGWEDNPANCTALTCPLYPWRVKTLKTQRGTMATHTGAAQ